MWPTVRMVFDLFDQYPPGMSVDFHRIEPGACTPVPLDLAPVERSRDSPGQGTNHDPESRSRTRVRGDRDATGITASRCCRRRVYRCATAAWDVGAT